MQVLLGYLSCVLVASRQFHAIASKRILEENAWAASNSSRSAQTLQEKQAQSCDDCGGSGTQAALAHKLSAVPQLHRVAATVCASFAVRLLRWLARVRARA